VPVFKSVCLRQNLNISESISNFKKVRSLGRMGNVPPYHIQKSGSYDDPII
jgi:hypothetical protein